MKVMKKLKNVNLIQFVPAVFVISMVGNSIFGYTATKVQKASVGAAKEVKAETKKAKAVSGGDLDLSKIKDGTYEGTGTGFHGTVKAAVTIKNNKIKSIKILEHHDDAAYFNRASGQLLPLIVKRQTTNVDTVSGATYSSNGIIKAVRNALSKAAIKSSSKKNEEKKKDKDKKPASENVSGTYKDGTYQGTGTGFQGKITVKVTIKYSKITQIQIVKNEKDDAAYFNRALGVIDNIIALQRTDVDVVSGATYSSNGIIEAVKNALKKALVKDDDNKKDDTDNDSQIENTNKPEESAGGTYTGTAVCLPDEDEEFDAYDLFLEIVVSDEGKVTAIQNVKGGGSGYFAADEWYINYAKKTILPKLLNGTSASQCDTVSGATCSSKAILEAYKNAVSQIKK